MATIVTIISSYDKSVYNANGLILLVGWLVGWLNDFDARSYYVVLAG